MSEKTMVNTDSPAPELEIQGFDHVVHVTWNPEETVRFYRDALELPLVHAVTGKGWVTDSFPDFVHFFFALGKGNHLAFFYFFGLTEDEPASDLMHRSRHIALHVETREELMEWRARLKKHGVRVTPPLTHELLESIYFDDPNGIQLEIARPLRSFGAPDSRDAALTLAALSDIHKKGEATLEQMWRRKAELIEQHYEEVQS
ncbi:VOC family protein [Salinactinospora qingdaonensis]|uniref:VOC domain-containing protein n=1 Tax=Salinactinospora qingdaonensis TaxID=702744 RepID=A0ABP7FVA9_9ACTN